MFKLDSEKEEALQIYDSNWNIPENFTKIVLCFIDYRIAFNCVDHEK